MQDDNDLLLLSSVLSKVHLFDDMNRKEVLSLLNIMCKSTYQAGHYVFREGDLGTTLYVLASGVAEVRKIATNNKMATLATLHPGDTFGEIALLRDRVRTASVYAREPCVVLSMEPANMEQMPEIAAKLFLNIARLLADRLIIANELLFDYRGRQHGR